MTDPLDNPDGARPSRIAVETPWYELFSRGARDWLRHNQKVREAVKSHLPHLLANTDIMARPHDRTVLVPVKLLEHARFRLRDRDTLTGAGQGHGEPGEILRPARPGKQGASGGGTEEGEVNFVLELKIDDILDWLWEELKLPDLKPRQGTDVEDADFVREGWDRRGPRSRLDRRRTVKEAVKRRAVQEDPVQFTNDDLRFRQLVRRVTPSVNAVVVFVIDVSGSMDEAQRKLAKTFFFFALQGIRRQYAKVDTVFIAHTVGAWEFSEEQFFQVAGSGGTTASSAFRLSLELLNKRYDPARFNAYLFYASDGENASDDHESAQAALAELGRRLNYIGYVELRSGSRHGETEMTGLFSELTRLGHPVGTMPVAGNDDVWQAIRSFFQDQAAKAA